MTRSGLYAYRANTRKPKSEAKRSAGLHANTRTDNYLRCLLAGAAVADPGDLDLITEAELTYRTATGELACTQDHGRRLWVKT